MFKSRRSIIAAALLSASLVGAPAAYAQQEAKQWILVVPAGEGFTVRLPVKPEEQAERVPIMGNTYLMHLYTSVDESSGMLYMVIMQEFSSLSGVLEPSKRIERFMSGFKEGMGRSLGDAGKKLELTPGRELDLKGHLGRQYAISLAESSGLVRVYDGTARVYVLLVMGGDERNTSVTRFFDSFEITPAPAPVPKPITPN